MVAPKVIYMVVAAAISYFASRKLMKEKAKEVQSDDRPLSSTTRGAWLPLLIGRRRLAPIIAWVKDRTGTGNVIRETAGHLLCIGPASRIHRIYFDGKVKYAQELNPQNSPSGTSIQVDSERSMKVYWGEKTQPAGVPTEIGSNFGAVCYVEWVNFLVDQRIWPEITYDIEVDPIDSGNVRIQSSIASSPANIGTYLAMQDTNNGFPSINYIEVLGDKVADFTDKQASVNLNDPINPDISLWTQTESVTTGTPRSLRVGIAGSPVATEEAYSRLFNLKNFPAVGKPLSFQLTFDYVEGSQAKTPAHSFRIWNSTRTVKIGEFNDFAKTIFDGSIVTPDPGFTYSVTPVTATSGNISITYFPQTDLYREQDFVIEFSLTCGVFTVSDPPNPNTQVDLYISNLTAVTASNYPIRNLILRDNFSTLAVPASIPTWSIVDSANGFIEYINNTDSDFQSPLPTEAVSAFQNRMEVTNTSSIGNSVSAKHDIPAFVYPAVGQKMTISFLMHPGNGNLRVGATTTAGSWLWYADLDMSGGTITPLPQNTTVNVQLSAASTQPWRIVTVTKTVDASESGSVGVALGHVFSLTNNLIGQATECFVMDLLINTTINNPITRIELNEDIQVLTDNVGQVAPATPAVLSGANAAGAIHQLLFKPYPYGAGFLTTSFDLPSLEDLSDLMAQEKLPLSILAKEGRDLEAILASILQDVGCLMFWDTTKGLWSFKAIREVATNTITDLPTNLLKKRPETVFNFDDSQPNQIVFGFSDLNRRFKETTLLYDNDGETVADYGGPSKRTRRTRLTNVIDINTARIISERRSQEELGKPATFKITSSDSSRSINPGDVITLEGDSILRRVLSVTEKANSPSVIIEAMTDLYGLPPVSASGEGDDDPNALIPKADLLNRFVELPRPLTNNQTLVMNLRVKSENQVIGASVYASYDNLTFFEDSDTFKSYTGGVLAQDLPATPNQIIDFDDGPLVTYFGRDPFFSVSGLTLTDAEWYNGQQICVINNEWFFLKQITIVNSTQFRLNGLVRGRFSSNNDPHLAGSQVYIFQASDISSIVTTPPVGSNFYGKSTPFNATGGELPITEVSSFSEAILGVGTRPPNPYGINTPEGSLSYLSGGNAVLSWNYRNGDAVNGAGQFGAGSANGTAQPEGTFTISITGPGTPRTVTGLTSPTYTYTNAQMVADHTTEPATFFVTVKNISPTGLESFTASATITKA